MLCLHLQAFAMTHIKSKADFSSTKTYNTTSTFILLKKHKASVKSKQSSPSGAFYRTIVVQQKPYLSPYHPTPRLHHQTPCLPTRGVQQEGHKLETKARENEAVVLSLVKMLERYGGIDFENDRASCTRNGRNLGRPCRYCGEWESCMVLLPCWHLCSCPIPRWLPSLRGTSRGDWHRPPTSSREALLFPLLEFIIFKYLK